MPPAPLVSSVPVPDPEAGMALRACHSAGCCDDVAPASPCVCTGSALQDLGQVHAQHGSRAEGPPRPRSSRGHRPRWGVCPGWLSCHSQCVFLYGELWTFDLHVSL